MREEMAYFAIPKKDFTKYMALRKEIELELKNKEEKILLRNFREMYELLKYHFKEQHLPDFFTLEKTTNQIVSYCKKEKGYFFIDESIDAEDISEWGIISNGVEVFDTSQVEFEYVSLRLMVRQSVKQAMKYLDESELDTNNKSERLKFTNEFVGVIYSSLQNYKIANLSKTLQKQLSHYKLTVITGLIIISLQPNLIGKFKDFVINNEELRPDDIKEPIAPYSKKFVKKYFLKK